MHKAERTQAFLELLEPLKEALERYTLRTSWSREQVGDIVQDAVMTAWREFDRFQRGTDFKAWMYRVLINTIYSHNKRLHRERQRRVGVAADDLQVVLQREDGWASILQDPERIVQALDQRLVAALEALGGEERHCLLLRVLEGFSYKEISKMLDMPMGTVMSHVHRARMRLRERLTELAIENGLVSGVSHELQ